MYKIKHIQFTVEDTLDNIDKILVHPSILIKKFQKSILWTNCLIEEYKYVDNMTIAYIDCYLKVKHRRRLKEMNSSWIISAKDVLLVVK